MHLAHKFFILLTILVSFKTMAASWEATPPTCTHFLNGQKYPRATVIKAEESFIKSPTEYRYYDTTYDFHFIAILTKGELTLDILLVDPVRKIRSQYSGADLYQKAIEHFGAYNIQRISGLWDGGDNYEKFVELKNKGYSDEDAALNTWSGQQAAKYGFIQIESIKYNKVKRRPQKVEVIFTRPTTPLKKVNGVLREYSLENRFTISDDQYSFTATGELIGRRLSFSIYMQDPDMGIRSAVSGGDLYDRIINHFGVENIDAIEGIWQDGTNHGQFFTHRALGFSEADAAKNTWSGQQAARHGFTEVKNINLHWNNNNGSTTVTAEFRRPNEKN